ncbi:MAG TPA: hypothetical protein VJ910_04580, partial [Desulfuromonadales bacterium]|nr:hypothetical protein [Desulfuromonadales bacterium]
NVGLHLYGQRHGPLVGTLLSGVVFQMTGLVGCLWVSAVFVLIGVIISLALPRQGAAGLVS